MHVAMASRASGNRVHWVTPCSLVFRDVTASCVVPMVPINRLRIRLGDQPMLSRCNLLQIISLI
jgi:hypothetical protein